MKILAFDTCFDACSAAVRRGAQGLVCAERLAMRRGHAEALMPMIDRVMQAAGMRFADLDRIAVTNGPGTFTGTRLGLAAALGFSLAHGTPVATASSLRVTALGAARALGDHVVRFDGIAVIRDARREAVYCEITDTTGLTLDGPRLASLDEARERLAGRRLFAAGSGIAVLEAAAGGALPGLVTQWPAPAPEFVTEPDARDLLDLAEKLPVTPHPAPLYLRPPDAKRPANPPLPRLADAARATSHDA